MSMGLKANADGSAAIQVGGSDAITITSGLNTTFVGTVTSPTGTLYPLVSGTAVASTSGTSIDFTGIPSTAKRITVMFNGVSTNGTSNYLIQLGSTTFSTSGYLGASSTISTAVTTTAFTAGFGIVNGAGAATFVVQGGINIALLNANTWIAFGTLGGSDAARTITTGGSSPTLAGTLDRVRITTVNGTDTFDAGSINIMWE